MHQEDKHILETEREKEEKYPSILAFVQVFTIWLGLTSP